MIFRPVLVRCSSVRICSVSDTLHALQRSAAGKICPARSVWYRVQAGAARPASGCVCLALRGLPCIWHGLSGCAGGAGVSTGGVYRERRGWGGQSFKFRSPRKRRFRRFSYQHPPHLYKTKPIRLCKSPKIPKKYKKTPLPV